MSSLSQNNLRLNDPFYDEKFHRIFNELYSPLCSYCYFLINNYEAAEDIVQEQFVGLWENWERLNPIESIKGYLFQSVKNRSINYLKNQSILIHPDENTLWLNFESKLPVASEMVENKELEKIIDQAIEQLPERCRAIFILKRIDEMSNKEIADQLNISVKTVEAQMTIALKRLYQFISNHWDFFILLTLFSLS